MDYLLLVIAWVCWCAMHSFLISCTMTGYMRSRFPGYVSWYRIFYNIFSLITLIAPVYCMRTIVSSPVFSWQGIMQFPRFAILLLALILFREGSKKYDLSFFLGIKQLKTGKSKTLLGDKEMFTATGVFGLIRHPWYSGSLLLVWSFFPVYTAAKVVTAAILSIYLVTGTLLEEKKILAEYREGYVSYQKDVSMLFPWKWLVRRLRSFFCTLLQKHRNKEQETEE